MEKYSSGESSSVDSAFSHFSNYLTIHRLRTPVHRRLTFRSPIRFFPDSTLLAFLFTSSRSSIWSFYFLFMRIGRHLMERVAMGRFILSFGIPLRLEAKSIWIIFRLASLEMLFMTLASWIFVSLLFLFPSPLSALGLYVTLILEAALERPF